MYQATVPDEPPSTPPVLLSEEDLVDSVADGGNRNLLRVQPETAQKYRRIVEDYAEVYPWLLFSGRSGVSKSPAKPNRR